MIQREVAFYFGTTATAPQTGLFLKFLKDRGYSIKFLHVTAPDHVRWRSIQERDKTFVQTTEDDTVVKGKWLHDRIMDTYLKYADEIVFYYRDVWDADAKPAATWIRQETGDPEVLGTLEIHDGDCYGALKAIHNAYCDAKGDEGLKWEATVEAHSKML